jgi:hypothetical protein
MSRETAELGAKVSDAFVPDAAALAQSPVKAGYEQQFIAELKMMSSMRTSAWRSLPSASANRRNSTAAKTWLRKLMVRFAPATIRYGESVV